MKKEITIIITILIICSINLFADTNFRVMSYNALNFDGTDRLTDFETVLAASAPDILICQEIKTESASDAILTILNSAFGGFARASFVNDGDLNNMLYYKTSIVTLVSQDVVDTSPRDISEYVMNIDGNPIRFYSCHLKASDGSTYEAERLAAVTILRDHLNGLTEGTEFIIAGDMNFYTSSEDGYGKFIADEGNNSRSQDLCSEVGNWHENSSYSDVHTQSTRTADLGDGGATGGMDDKFDFIFGNYGINNGSGIEYSSSSFTSYGNDGAHFDQSINNGTNSAVPANVADALYYASDHLPVYADFVSLSGTQPLGSLIISEYIEGSSINKAIEIYNGTGAAVDLSAYSLEKDLNGNEVWDYTYNYNGTLAHGDVFVLANSQADSAILAVADDTDNEVINFNGDDQVHLLKYGIEIDRIGIPGDIDFAKDVTYVRKSTVTEPLNGPQDPRSNGEWDEYPIDTFSYLGSHSSINPTITVTSPNGSESWERDNPYDITWTSNDFTGNVKIELYKNSTSAYSVLIASTVNDELWEWNIPLEQSIASDFKIRISDANDGNPFDESDDFFSITGTQPETQDVFFSEYIEGSSNNKALEIYNNSGSTISLENFRINQSVNGGGWQYQHAFPAGATLASGDVWVIITDTVVLPLFDPANADEILSYPSVVHHNGDDARGLEYTEDGGSNWILLDLIGDPDNDPGTGWAVAGTTGATANHTLVRKSDVIEGNTDWAVSAGTTPENSEWIVYPQDTFDYFGAHTIGGNALPLINNIERTPAGDILSTTTVSISANVTDSDGTIDLVELHWGLTSGSLINTINMSTSERATYTTSTDIPVQTVGTIVYYEVYAEDNVPESSVSAEYDYTVVDVSTTSLPYSEDFTSGFGAIYTYDFAGNDYWYITSGYANINGYPNDDEADEDWMILPRINFGDYTEEQLAFDAWWQYGNQDANNYLKLFYSSDYPGLGDPTSSTWNELTFAIPPIDLTWTLTVVDLSALPDNDIYLGFRYYSDDAARKWEIDNISITGTGILDAPTNVVITHNGADVTISWDAVAGATLYHVYSSEDPNSGFELDESGVFNNNSWTTVLSTKKFYRVTAE